MTLEMEIRVNDKMFQQKGLWVTLAVLDVSDRLINMFRCHPTVYVITTVAQPLESFSPSAKLSSNMFSVIQKTNPQRVEKNFLHHVTVGWQRV